MGKPDVDSIEGLSPAIPIEQKSTSHNPRSTVGTVTEIYDYLRLLFARSDAPPAFNAARKSQRKRCSRWWMPSACCRKETSFSYWLQSSGRKSEYRKEFLDMRRAGYIRARVDGQLVDLGEDIALKNRRNTRSKSSSIGW